MRLQLRLPHYRRTLLVLTEKIARANLRERDRNKAIMNEPIIVNVAGVLMSLTIRVLHCRIVRQLRLASRTKLLVN